MSNIYIQEPPSFGKVLLKTTVGDIDVELWSKEAPKACRNFIQLCEEGYYNGTIFHRVVKDFIVQGGDPTGSGEGGESVYGHPFKDEFHTRLRFCRRGLLAMANAGKDDNGSQFFFTMAATQELQNKHTIFAKVTGETVFNMLKLQEGIVDHNDRPQFPQKILKTVVLNNPFPDIVPRNTATDGPKEGKRKREKKSGVKDFKLLSFGAEAEEDEEETERENKRFSGRSKSTHDLLDDPKLSSTPAILPAGQAASSESSDLSEDHQSDSDSDSKKREVGNLERVRSKLIGRKSAKTEAVVSHHNDDGELEAYSLGQDKRDERLKKTEAIKKEIRDLRRNMKRGEEPAPLPEVSNETKQASQVLQDYKKDRELYENNKKQLPAKGGDREAFTLSLLAKFQKKLEAVKEKADGEPSEEAEQPADVDEADFGNDDGKWMARKLKFNDGSVVLARDANTKDQKPEDWFQIDDPRNPINQRRREASKSKR